MTLDDAMQVLPVLVFAIVPSAARWHTWLVFVGDGEWVHALIRDRAVARAVLRCLPPSLPLSPAAAALRGEVPHLALSQEPPHCAP